MGHSQWAGGADDIRQSAYERVGSGFGALHSGGTDAPSGKSAAWHVQGQHGMSSGRPRLVIIGGEDASVDALSAELGDRYEIVVAPSARDVSAEQRDAVQAVLIEAEDASVGDGDLGAEPAVALLNAIGEGVCLVGPDARVVWANDRFCAFDETVRARVIQVCRQAHEFIADGAGGSEGSHQGSGSSSPTCKFDIEDTETRRHYDVYVTPAKLSSGGDHVAAVVRDVTKRVRMERKMTAIDQAGATLMDVHADEIRNARPAERLKLLQTRITQYTHEVLHFDHFIVRLVNEETGKLEPVISEGMPPSASDLSIRIENEGSGIMGFVAATGQSYICNDAEADERFLPGLPSARSSLTVPLRLQDRVIGVMNIESPEPAAFTDLDRQFAEIFARYIAMALHMLDLLVVERCTTNKMLSGRVEGELRECLEDILSETDWLTGIKTGDPELAEHVDRIKTDVERIRKRVRDVADGPQTLLGVERAMEQSERDPLLSGKRVLVADDTQKIRHIIRDVLTAVGCDVEVCEDGGQAIEQLSGCVERGRPFDLVISDIKMPDRNGYEVFTAAKKAIPDVPVVLMTGFGYDPHHSIVRASEDGLQCVLFKPFQIERLLEEVRKAFAVASDGGSA